VKNNLSTRPLAFANSLSSATRCFTQIFQSTLAFYLTYRRCFSFYLCFFSGQGLAAPFFGSRLLRNFLRLQNRQDYLSIYSFLSNIYGDRFSFCKPLRLFLFKDNLPCHLKVLNRLLASLQGSVYSWGSQSSLVDYNNIFQSKERYQRLLFATFVVLVNV